MNQSPPPDMAVQEAIKIALSKSARAHGFESMKDAAIDAYNKSDFTLLALIVNRAMEIYGESCKQQLRDKLPTDEMIDAEYPDIYEEGDIDTFSSNIVTIWERKTAKDFRDKIKELLK